MKEKEIAKWKKIREKGKGNYIAKYCILLAGIPSGIIAFFTYDLIIKGLPKIDFITVLSYIIAGVLFGIIYGIIYGSITWKINEKYIKKVEEKNIEI